jgi:predicted transcriptional regulator
VGHYIVLGATEGKPVTSDLVDEAIELAKTDFETDVCDTTLRALSDVDIDFLNAMTADGEKSRTSDVANRLDVSVDYAQKYRRRLIDSGVIEAAGRGYVRFAVPYLADHLRRTQG